jgi:hypothetical protein
VRLSDDPIAHTLIQRPAKQRAQQAPCLAIAETLDEQLREPLKRHARFADRENKRDRLLAQAPRDERQRPHRRLVEPL